MACIVNFLLNTEHMPKSGTCWEVAIGSLLTYYESKIFKPGDVKTELGISKSNRRGVNTKWAMEKKDLFGGEIDHNGSLCGSIEEEISNGRPIVVTAVNPSNIQHAMIMFGITPPDADSGNREVWMYDALNKVHEFYLLRTNRWRLCDSPSYEESTVKWQVKKFFKSRKPNHFMYRANTHKSKRFSKYGF